MVLDDAGLDEIPLDPFDADMRTLLVGLHQATVGSDVADNDRCETTRHSAVWRRPILISGSEVANFAHFAGTPQTCKGGPAYDGEKQSSVKAITLMIRDNVPEIAGIKFQRAKPQRARAQSRGWARCLAPPAHRLRRKPAQATS